MRLMTITILLVATLGLAACGSSSPGTATAASNTKQASGLAFARCVRAHGVPNFPDPGSNGHGGVEVQQSQRSGSGPTTAVNGVPVNGPAFRAAMNACGSYLPNGGHPTAAETAKFRAQALAKSRCMRSHGVPDFPDPTFPAGPNGGAGVELNGSGIDRSSPAFQAAQKACGSIFGGLTQKTG